MATNDTEYYRGRAISERALAMAAQNPLVGVIHENWRANIRHWRTTSSFGQTLRPLTIK
jgi:hypothetical protein